jgi:two-component system chemotaxis response regulator CheY
MMQALSNRPPFYGPLKVLVVGDEPMARQALERAVRALGHECRTAPDGAVAFEMHRRERADVILSDSTMPNVDGVELCRRTREADGDADYTYFILMTAPGEREHFLAGMNAGADDYHVKPVDFEELAARLLSAGRVLSLYRRLADINTSLRRDSQASFALARTDMLTGLGNRRRMQEDLEVAMASATRYGRKYSLGLCDIDWFKALNDERGHVAGDDVLRRAADAMKKSLRQSDGLFRYGGEEFLVLLPEQSLSDATLAMDRLRACVEGLEIRAARDHGRVVTISVGVAELSGADENMETWIGRADAALYRAKTSGRNRVVADQPS